MIKKYGIFGNIIIEGADMDILTFSTNNKLFDSSLDAFNHASDLYSKIGTKYNIQPRTDFTVREFNIEESLPYKILGIRINYMVDKSKDSEGIRTYCYEYGIFYDYNDMCKFINEY